MFTPATKDNRQWLTGTKGLAERIRDHDWASTPLGPIEQWPQSLMTIVNLMLVSPSMMSLVWGPEAIHLYNDSFTELLFEHHVEAPGKSAFETFARSREVFDADIAAGMSGKSARLLAQRYSVLRNGRLENAWFDVDYAPVCDESGKVAGVLWTLREVTAQVSAEHALRENEARHRLLIESWAQAVWETDPDGIVSTDSPSWRAYTGQTVEDWFGYGWLNAIHPDDRSYAELQWRDAIAARGLINAEFRLRAPEGGWRWTNMRAAPVLDPEGKIEKWAGMNIDIDARKRAETILRESADRQAFLLKLSDALRPLSDPSTKQTEAMKFLVEHLGLVKAVCYGINDDQDGMELIASVETDAVTLPQRMLISDFGSDIFSAYRLGQVYQVGDVKTDYHLIEGGHDTIRDFGVRRSARVPLIKDGRLVAVLGVYTREPRDWRDDELHFLGEVAERIWSSAERARVEQALVESETRFREFSENSSDALWIINIQTMRLEYLSPAFERIWGESRDTVMADISHWAKMVHPDDRNAASEAMPHLLAGEAFQADYRIIRPDGKVRWIRDAGFPIKEGGIVKRGGGIARDVTDFKQAEAAVRESEARLLSFGDASQDILWIRDAETLQWQYLTPAFKAIYGQSREQALSGDNYRNWLELIISEDRAHAIESITHVKAGKEVAFEYRIRRVADGAIRWLRNTDFPIRDEAGNVTLIGGISHDFTELREAEQRLQALIDGIPQLVWRADTAGLSTWASPQWTAFTGQQEMDSHGWGWLETLHPDDRNVARDAWSQAGVSGNFQVEYRIGYRGQAYRWFQTRAVPVRDKGGEIIEWLGTSTDIHEMRLLQDRQQVMVQELQHRTRNLITVVSALSRQTLKNAASLSDFDHHFKDRLSALSRVQGLLSHLSAGKRVTFDELLGSELAALGAPNDKVTLDGPKGVLLKSATVQTFSLALHELATNALKYGALAALGGHLTVRWSVTQSDREGARLQVDWRETGVVLTHVADRSCGGGYGRELIERALPYQLDARTSYELAGDGVHCTIDVPASITGTELD